MNKILEKIKSLLKGKKRLVYGLLAVLLIVIIILAVGKNKNGDQVITIKTGDFMDQVSISGKVVPSESVELSFKNSGRIGQVYFQRDQLGEKVQVVKRGTTIAELDASDARKDVHDAEIALADAKLSLEKLQLENSSENLNSNLQKSYDDGFITVSDTFIDLPATLDGLKDILNQPNVSDNTARGSGTTAVDYKNNAENLYYKAKEAYDKNKADFRVLDRNSSRADIEKIISETYDTTKVLMDAIKSTKNLLDYLAEDTSRPADYTASKNSISEYTSTINGHLSSLLAIKTSIKNYKDAFSSTDLDTESLSLAIRQKENALNDARNKLADYYIIAPFDGIITKMDAKVGEIASPNTSLVSMMSTGTFQIESYVPEVRISKIKMGDKANVTLDAYGTGTIFQAQVVSIDPAETIKDGVSTYKVKLQFENEDPRIKSGMTASVTITAFQKPNTIVVPGGVIFEKDGKKFVQVKEEGEIYDREIATGSESSLNQVEVLSGLKDGDVVLLNPTNSSGK